MAAIRDFFNSLFKMRNVGASVEPEPTDCYCVNEPSELFIDMVDDFTVNDPEEFELHLECC